MEDLFKNFTKGGFSKLLEVFLDEMYSKARTSIHDISKSLDETILNSNPNIERTEEIGKDENGEWTRKTWKSKDGKFFHQSTIYKSKQTQSTSKYTLEELERQLKEAQDNQDFEKCIEIRDQIKEIKK